MCDRVRPLLLVLGLGWISLALGCQNGMGPLPDLDHSRPVPNGVKVIVVGSAQDAGIPQLGCHCLHCRVALESEEGIRRVASLGVVSPESGEILLIDAGPDVRFQVGKLCRDEHVGLHSMRKPVDAVALTHAHLGHYVGLLHLGFEAANAESIPLYATQSMIGFLENNEPFRGLFERGNLVPKPIVPGEWIEVAAGVQLRPIRVLHRDELSDTVGFIIKGSEKSLLYIPDIDSWERWDVSIRELITQVDYALLDGTFFSAAELPDRDLEDIPHPTIETTMELLKETVSSSSVRVFFTHLNHSNPVHRPGTPERKRVEAEGFHVAEDGMVFWL